MSDDEYTSDDEYMTVSSDEDEFLDIKAAVQSLAVKRQRQANMRLCYNYRDINMTSYVSAHIVNQLLMETVGETLPKEMIDVVMSFIRYTKASLERARPRRLGWSALPDDYVVTDHTVLWSVHNELGHIRMIENDYMVKECKRRKTCYGCLLCARLGH